MVIQKVYAIHTSVRDLTKPYALTTTLINRLAVLLLV